MDKSIINRSHFRWRALTSVLITAAFLVLLLSGIILFIAPPGRVANWTNWAILGLRKSEWAGLHITFSALFLSAALLHIIFNWRPLLSYFRTRWGEASGLRFEWVAALVLVVGFYVGTRANWPPFTTLIAYSNSIRESWETPRQRAPIPHAELLTLQELANQASVNMSTVSSRLEAKGIKGFTTNTIVQELANQSGLSAQQLYGIMTAAPAEPAVAVGASMTRSGEPGHGLGRGGRSGPGGGPGRKKLTEFCADEGIDLQTALKRLEAKGIKASAELTMREIAVNNGYERPYELLGILRGENK
jgi:hypothetical protein